MKTVDPIAFEKECTFRTTRSGGKGGQHVNKVETKVILIFAVPESVLFTEEEKAILLNKLNTRLTQEGILRLSSEKARSQYQNKQLVIEKAIILLEKALKPVTPRKKTKPTTVSVEKRLQHKQVQSEKKHNRTKVIA